MRVFVALFNRGIWSVQRVCLFLCLALSLAAFGCGGENTKVVMETSEGNVAIELFDSSAPITVANFLAYVDEKHYDNTIFHRVSDKLVQGGHYTADLKKQICNLPIKNEAYNRRSNVRGTVAMARTDDPDSATDEFFVNVKNNIYLNRDPAAKAPTAGYCVFGQVTEGMDVVDKIASANTGPEGFPANPVVIKTIRRSK
jgi:cyclophilin family peptidyl-prolyl cis-trans isomerase